MKALYLIKCVAVCHIWSRARSNRLCDRKRQPYICERLLCSLLWTVWMFGWLDSCLSMVHCWLGPPCVCVYVSREGGLALFSNAGGWPGHRRRMSEYVSGAALTVILVPSFHQKGLCVCECVYVVSHLTWYHLCLQHTCRQLCIQTSSIAHTFLHPHAPNYK